MSPFTCPRERDVADLIRRGYWPEVCPAELRTHVESCRSCSDLVLVTETLQAAHRQSAEVPRLEPAGVLWWRAQLRRRNAALEKMARPILGAQLFALAMAVVVAVSVLIWQAGTFSAWIEGLPRSLHLDALIPASISNSDGTLWIIVPILATIALLSGVVVYLVSEKQ